MATPATTTTFGAQAAAPPTAAPVAAPRRSALSQLGISPGPGQPVIGIDPVLTSMLDETRASHSQLLNTAMEELNAGTDERAAVMAPPMVRPEVPELERAPEPPPQQMEASGTRVFAQFLPVVAMLGGALARNSVTALLKTGASAMKAARDNDVAELELRNQDWENQLQRIESDRKATLDEYNAVLQDATLDLNQRQALLAAIASREDNVMRRVQASSGRLKELMEGIQLEMNALGQITEANYKNRMANAAEMKARRGSGATAAASQQLQQQTQSVLNAIADVRRYASDDTTGWRGLPGINMIPGDANNLRNAIDTVVANVGFDRLQQMRAASPTGGALGSVTERELKLLQDSMASLNQSQTYDQFIENLNEVEQNYLRTMQAITDMQAQDAAIAGGDADSTEDVVETVETDADYDALPSGTEFVGPDGVRRRKP